MSELSREYWRDPGKYGKTEREVVFGRPRYYADQDLLVISHSLATMLERVAAEKEWSILEVGCNCGRNINHLADKGYKNVTGVEINPESAEYAWDVFPNIASNITVSDAQSFLAMCWPNRFDIVYTQSVLMHVPTEDEYLFGQMSRVASRFLLICEVEKKYGSLLRHKYARNYQEVFEPLGWKQIDLASDGIRTLRMFRKCQQ